MPVWVCKAQGKMCSSATKEAESMKCEKCGQEIETKVRTKFTTIEFDAEYSIVTLRIDNCRVKVLGRYNHFEVDEKGDC